MDIDDTIERRWGSLKQLRQRYPVGRTRAYDLLNQGKLRARKLGRQTVWDFASAEELFASLPDYTDEA